MMKLEKPKVAVIGCGAVGSTCASSMIMMDLSVDILLVDVVMKVAEGQALDLADSTFGSSASVSCATPKEAGQADIIVITAGAPQKPGETRLQLVQKNCNILKSVLDGMQPINKNAIILLVANPVDILTTMTRKITGFPQNQVFGSGTFLDTQRLRIALSEKLGIAASAIHCYQLGEHGDHQFANWDSAIVGGVPIRSYIRNGDVKELDKVAHDAAMKAYSIIEKKGATHYGIGCCVALLVKSIINDQRKVFPVSCFREEYGCYVSSPASIGSKGVHRTINLNLSSGEKQKMDEAVAAMDAAMAGVIL